jgi:hypothetical protein
VLADPSAISDSGGAETELCSPDARQAPPAVIRHQSPRIPQDFAIEGEGSFVTDTTNLTPGLDENVNAAAAAPAKSSGLAGLKLAQLQALAGQLGITGGSRMRKGDLVAAISDHQRGSSRHVRR